MYLLDTFWIHCLRNHNEITMYLLDKCPLSPSEICLPNLKSPDVKTAKWHSDLLWAQTATMPSLSLYHFYGFSLTSRSSLQQSFMYVLLYLTESFQLTDFCSSCTSSYLSRPTQE